MYNKCVRMKSIVFSTWQDKADNVILYLDVSDGSLDDFIRIKKGERQGGKCHGDVCLFVVERR